MRYVRVTGTALYRAAVFCAVILMCSPVYAQRLSQLAREETGGYLPWVIAVVIGVVVCLPAFLNPKRSHLT